MASYENGGITEERVSKFDNGASAIQALLTGKVDCVVIDSDGGGHLGVYAYDFIILIVLVGRELGVGSHNKFRLVSGVWAFRIIYENQCL